MEARLNSVDDTLALLQQQWQVYAEAGTLDQFIELTLTLSNLAVRFRHLQLIGLMQLCETLENQALAYFGDATDHALDSEKKTLLGQAVEALFEAVQSSRLQPNGERRTEIFAALEPASEWVRPRNLWLVCPQDKAELAAGLKGQLEFFGFNVISLNWGQADLPETMALATIFIATQAKIDVSHLSYISTIRKYCPTCQLLFLGSQRSLRTIIDLIRAGIDVTIPEEEEAYGVLNSILELVQINAPEKSKVLIIEDSRVAIEVIQRALRPNGIETFAISDPENMIAVLDNYQPDMILMDMHMPNFNGVEATRVLRQLSAYRSIPVVYLSAETDIGMQVEALKLGGDQFLTKPFNPMLLAAIVKAKIERFRETLRSSQIDGLTGLLNHTAVKSRLQSRLSRMGEEEIMSVAMLDIDLFKSINDTYGHPVGDQVIRGLAWLLKGRLRATDLIGRYGGEEFLIALPGVGIEQAKKIINKIREDFALLPHTHQEGAVHASFSAGVAAYPCYVTSADITQAADNALLEAKRLGRNRVELART